MNLSSRIHVPGPVLLLNAVLVAFVCGGLPAHAQTPADKPAPASDADLAKQLSNPVASLVSVPLQFNWDQQVGIDDDTRLTMNFQPVIPMGLNEDWNMILRWIMPYVAQPRLFDGGAPTSGLSDIVASVFFSPAKPGRFIWGVGPVLLLPATADPLLGTGKWGAGPTFVILKQSGGWTYGVLANQIWSFAGDDFTGGAARSDVNSTFIQPFVAYTTSTAVTYGLNLEASANWEAVDDDEWTVPLHLTATKLTKFGPFPMSIGGGIGIFTAAPGGRPDWRVRFVATLLLPIR
jgi:hypothetical protein